MSCENRGQDVDQAYDPHLREDPKKSIRKGFFWIGLASTFSQGLTALAMFIVMFFLTTEEMGVATLAVAFCVVFEALNSLGTNQAILQTKELTPEETHSVFWFSTGFSLTMAVLCVPLAWPIASFYGVDLLVPLLIVTMFKLPLSSIAAVPLQLINRRFEYRKISAIQSLTTIGCSVLKIGLAALGFGAWSLVIGETAYGLGSAIGAFALSGYRPRFHFRWSECRRFVVFGVKYCVANAINQFNKNLHYLIIGKFLGQGVLGVYRIAYEFAMTPALALFDVVAKSSFPVFSRLQNERGELLRLFLWNQRSLALFAAIPTVFILFAAGDIFDLMPNAEWTKATPLIPYVLALSFFKSLMQTYPDLYRACGKPSWPIFFFGAEVGLIALFCSAALYFVPWPWSLRVMILTWLGILFVLFFVHQKVSRLLIDISAVQTIRTIGHGLAFVAMGIALSIVQWMIRSWLPWPEWTHLGLELVLVLATIAGYARFVLRIRLRDLMKQHKRGEAHGAGGGASG